MVGKRIEAERIAKWLGSNGEIGGTPPEYFFVAEAAKELGCSFIELDSHPDKYKLMAKAFTLQRAWHDAKKMWAADAESKAKVNA